MRKLVFSVALLVVAASCGDPGGPVDPPPVATTSPVTTVPVATSPITTTPVTTSAVGLDVPVQLEDYDTTTISIDDLLLTVSVADTPEKRAQGLMHVTDLGDLDGMLFSYRESGIESFWMKDTVVPLDIAFFRVDGSLVHVVLGMEPCPVEPCARYGPTAQFRYAIEVPAGDFAWLTGTELLTVEP